MAYIGKIPAAAALTSSDIADSIITEAKMADDAISLTELKAGTDGELITWDASGNPAAVAAGTSGHFLKSQGAGSVPVFAAASGGKIGQVLSVTQPAALSTNATSWTDMTGVTLAITPSATSSKILWNYNVMIGSNADYGHVKIVYGDGSDLTTAAIGTAYETRTRGTSGGFYQGETGEDHQASMQGLDSPATTSATTYKLQWFLASGYMYLNRGVLDGNNATSDRNISTLTLMEIGA